MPSAPVLAISGKRFYGKDTLADLLCELAAEAGSPLLRCALADQSKLAFSERQAAEGTEVDVQRLQSDRAYKESWRPQLTVFTEAELARDPLVFCKRVFATPLPAGTHGYLITDVRLSREVECLRERGVAFLARLRLDDASRERFGWTFLKGVDDHRTEIELDDRDDWDAYVDNPGSREGLAEAAAALLARFWTACPPPQFP